jgi:hypothetical protein
LLAGTRARRDTAADVQLEDHPDCTPVSVLYYWHLCLGSDGKWGGKPLDQITPKHSLHPHQPQIAKTINYKLVLL